MEVTRINCGLPAFKALNVNSTSPLVSGNWQYTTAPNDNSGNTAKPKKKSSFLKKALITAAVALVAAFALAKARGMESINAVMEKGSFKELTSFGDKVKYVIGKAGDGVIYAYKNTIGRLLGHGANEPKPQPQSESIPTNPSPIPTNEPLVFDVDGKPISGIPIS